MTPLVPRRAPPNGSDRIVGYLGPEDLLEGATSAVIPSGGGQLDVVILSAGYSNFYFSAENNGPGAGNDIGVGWFAADPYTLQIVGVVQPDASVGLLVFNFGKQFMNWGGGATPSPPAVQGYNVFFVNVLRFENNSGGDATLERPRLWMDNR